MSDIAKELPVGSPVIAGITLENISAYNWRTKEEEELIWAKIPQNSKKRHFYNGVDYDVDDEKITIGENFLNKLRKNRLWGRLGFQPQYATKLFNFADERFSSLLVGFSSWVYLGIKPLSMKYINAGNVYESKIIEFLKERYKNFNFFDDEGVMRKMDHIYTEFDNVDKYNFFKSITPHFGGRPDALMMMNDKGNIFDSNNILIEIKTTNIKNRANLINYGPSSSYKMQASLYCYLMGIKKYRIVYYLLNESEYYKEEEIDSNRIIEFDFDMDEIKTKKTIEKVMVLRENLFENGEWGIIDDSEQIDYIKIRNSEENKRFLIKKAMREGV